MPKIADFPGCPAVLPARNNDLACEDYEFSLLTPMFGGGVEAGVPDPDSTMRVRATTIRGHLEFWWRASIGAVCSTSTELFNAHSRIWGSTAAASKVQIEVAGQKMDDPVPCAGYDLINGQRRLRWKPPLGQDYAYALFPFTGKLERNNVTKAPANCVLKGSFTVRARFPQAMRGDVETALRLWANFGGVGARTRRGCGALYCARFAPNQADPLAMEAAHADAAREWPTLPAAALMRPSVQDPMRAWAEAISSLREMRQGSIGRSAINNRSFYPEAQAIRRVVGPMGHPRLQAIPDWGYPRAEFGLPIIFQFRDGGHSEPRPTELRPVWNGLVMDRMASPLIIRPLKLRDGKAVPLILRLNAPIPHCVELRASQVPQDRQRANFIRNPLLGKYTDSPLANSPLGSALEAFELFLKTKGYQAVAL